MSETHIKKMACPRCGKESDFVVWDSINTLQNPEMKAKVRSGDAFVFECPHCGSKTQINYTTLYNQAEDHVMIYLVTKDSDKAIEIVDQMMGKDGKVLPFERVLSKEYTKRVVINPDQFKEKLLILDAGLDDRIVEIMKMMMIAVLSMKEPDTQIREFLFDRGKDGEFKFTLNLGNGRWGSTGYSQALYEHVKSDFKKELEEEKNPIMVDSKWAFHVMEKKRKGE